MKIYTYAVSIAAMALSGVTFAQQTDTYTEQQITQAALTSQTDICWNQPIPTGYAVIAHKTTSACSGTNYPGQPNTKTIKQPDPAGEIVCSSPFPTGFVITYDKINVGSTCAGNPGGSSGYNALNIKLAGQQEVVCSNSPVPSGYSYSSTYPSSNCRTGYAKTITKL